MNRSFFMKTDVYMIEEKVQRLIDRLDASHSLEKEEYEYLISHRTEEAAQELASRAVTWRKQYYGSDVYIRGLIEISNICRNNCLYCGIRRDNRHCSRYRLSPEEILSCAREGYALGFRTFVLQGGEDGFFTDDVLIPLIRQIKTCCPDAAVTLSLGERAKESYQALFDAGADRYLLRHETADPDHYRKLHPPEMYFEHRMQCLQQLREIGYQTGAGFMVGSPFQTDKMLAEDLKFIEYFHPQMCGIGPFIPHHDTPFAGHPPGTLELTCYLLSIIRLIHPPILLPATTALGTIDPKGREKGILSGANVVMPNLSPVRVRAQYELYDGKICTGDESAQCLGCLSRRMQSIQYDLVVSRGDYKNVQV